MQKYKGHLRFGDLRGCLGVKSWSKVVMEGHRSIARIFCFFLSFHPPLAVSDSGLLTAHSDLQLNTNMNAHALKNRKNMKGSNWRLRL